MPDIFSYIWNNLPHWEIGGRTPSELGRKRDYEGVMPQLEKHATAFSPSGDIDSPKRKFARNELCPRGSGRKYKKCCGV